MSVKRVPAYQPAVAEINLMGKNLVFRGKEQSCAGFPQLKGEQKKGNCQLALADYEGDKTINRVFIQKDGETIWASNDYDPRQTSQRRLAEEGNQYLHSIATLASSHVSGLLRFRSHGLLGRAREVDGIRFSGEVNCQSAQGVYYPHATNKLMKITFEIQHQNLCL